MREPGHSAFQVLPTDLPECGQNPHGGLLEMGLRTFRLLRLLFRGDQRRRSVNGRAGHAPRGSLLLLEPAPKLLARAVFALTRGGAQGRQNGPFVNQRPPSLTYRGPSTSFNLRPDPIGSRPRLLETLTPIHFEESWDPKYLSKLQ